MKPFRDTLKVVTAIGIVYVVSWTIVASLELGVLTIVLQAVFE